jgi:hypothetical protein
MDIGKYAIAQKGNVNIKSGKHKQEGPDNVNLEALVMSGVRNLVLNVGALISLLGQGLRTS